MKIVAEEFMWRKCSDALNIVTAPSTILLTVPGKPGGPGEPVSPWREEKNVTKYIKRFPNKTQHYNLADAAIPAEM